jgi:hypothetical protein
MANVVLVIVNAADFGRLRDWGGLLLDSPMPKDVGRKGNVTGGMMCEWANPIGTPLEWNGGCVRGMVPA